MATPNYNYEKRQRDLAKKKKKEDKLKERESRKTEGDASQGSQAPQEHDAPSEEPHRPL